VAIRKLMKSFSVTFALLIGESLIKIVIIGKTIFVQLRKS